VILVSAGGMLVARAGWDGRVAIPLVLALVFALLGLWDDAAKMRAGNTRGIKARWRLLVEFLAAWGALAWMLSTANYPGAKDFPLNWGFAGLGQSPDTALQIVWILLGGLVIVATANAVNITDGVDGLAASVSFPVALGLAVACFFRGMGDLTVLAAAVAGTALGFLWWNSHPAKIFMGDVGSLGLGALLGGLAVVAGMEWFFAIIAVVFVMETLSVILQVISFKLTGKRIFRMAPLHHAYELRGWSEPQVVARFALVAVVACSLGLLLMLALSPG